ncbi:hypothetical protein DMA11_10010 [Marinilabiliaceae bacterium JC017]|nr:hypothetical protein DMA11_10010 [Marinilabiliaceae bacterium JC017]
MICLILETILNHYPMNYVLIRNGQIVTADKVFKSDLLIGNNKILEIREGIKRPDPETPVINALGKYILPGAIDTFRSFSEPGLTSPDKIIRLVQSELLSGTTSMIEMLEPLPHTDCFEEIEQHKKRAAQTMLDYGFHLATQGWRFFSGREMSQCYVNEGITSFIIKWPMGPSLKEDVFNSILTTAKTLDLLLVFEIQIPLGDGSGYIGRHREFKGAILQHLKNLKLALERVVDAGCRALFLNISFSEELELIQEAQKKGSVLAELTLPCYVGDHVNFSLDDKSMLSGFPLAGLLNLIPADQLWYLLQKDGFLIARPSLNLVIDDLQHQGQVYNRPDQFFLLKYSLSMLFTSGVANGHITISDFCSMVSSRPAKVMGLYPRKGLLRAGSDADIVIWDPDYERNLYCSYPQKHEPQGKSQKLRGRAEFVFVNGSMAYDGESVYPEKLKGQFLYRNPPNNV